MMYVTPSLINAKNRYITSHTKQSAKEWIEAKLKKQPEKSSNFLWHEFISIRSDLKPIIENYSLSYNHKTIRCAYGDVMISTFSDRNSGNKVLHAFKKMDYEKPEYFHASMTPQFACFASDTDYFIYHVLNPKGEYHSEIYGAWMKENDIAQEIDDFIRWLKYFDLFDLWLKNWEWKEDIS